MDEILGRGEHVVDRNRRRKGHLQNGGLIVLNRDHFKSGSLLRQALEREDAQQFPVVAQHIIGAEIPQPIRKVKLVGHIVVP